jgi:phage terminase small subunit
MPTLLDPREEAFVQHYCANGGNARQAWIDAKFSPTTAPFARRMLQKAPVAARVAEVLGQHLADVHMDAARTKRLLVQAATFDVRDMYDENGAMLPVHKWPDELAECVQAIDVEVTRARKSADPDDPGYNEVEETVVKKVRFIDKGAARQLLARHFKLVGAEDDGVNALANALADRLNEAKHRRIHNLDDVSDATLVEPRALTDDPSPAFDAPAQPAVYTPQESSDESLV